MKKTIILLCSMLLLLTGCSPSSEQTDQVIGMNAAHLVGIMSEATHSGVYIQQNKAEQFYATTATISEIVTPVWSVCPDNATVKILSINEQNERSDISITVSTPAKFELIASAGNQQAVIKISVIVTPEQLSDLVSSIDPSSLDPKLQKQWSKAQKGESDDRKRTDLYYELAAQ